MQDDYSCFVMIADIQALSDNFDCPEKIHASTIEVCKDYLAVGLDPAKTTIFLQSRIPELFELTVYFLNLVSVARLERNPTVKTELRSKNFGDSVPAGFLVYPVSQAADIIGFDADLVPVGEDQLPVIEVTNEIVRRFNRIYNTDILREVTPVVGTVGRLVGIDGNAKASKSLNNAIFLSDPENVVREKVFSMYTDPGHIHVSDPGKVEGNVVFAYLDAFCEDKAELDSLKERYKKGGLGDNVVKNLLNDTLQKMLKPIREKRNSITDTYAFELLMDGVEKAKKRSSAVAGKIRDCIGFRAR